MSTTSTTAKSTTGSSIQLIKRPSEERGHADHGWLRSFHSFNFAGYYDPDFSGFGSLRVINEDRVDPNKGFGTHAHREFEIFSYIVDGELQHRDSMGNTEVLKRGDVQLTSAGTGIRHSEMTHGSSPVHFLQIWSVPSVSKLQPKYFTRHFTDAEKLDKLVTIIGPLDGEGVLNEREGEGPAPVQSPLWLHAGLITPGAKVEHNLKTPGPGSKERKAYIHVIQTSGYNTGKAKGNKISVNGSLEIAEGDGAFVTGAGGDVLNLLNVGDGVAEVLLFDLE